MHRRRRYVLYYLQETGGAVEADALARQVCAWERDTAVANISEAEAERVLTDFYHNHLPRLAEAGMIDYDQRTLTARLWEHAELLTAVLKFLEQIERG